jgi:hypothetical protein
MSLEQGENYHNVGIYFKSFFDATSDYFNLIKDSHEFQCLTESNKNGVAYRTGIYLSNVTKYTTTLLLKINKKKQASSNILIKQKICLKMD